MRVLIGLVFTLFLFSFPQQSLAVDAVPIRGSVGQTITLDPTDGFDAPAAHRYSIEWHWVSRPATSVANFSAIDVLRPQVTLDVPGSYEAEMRLFLEEPFQDPAIAHTVRIQFGTENLAPVADIKSRGLFDGAAPLQLDGSDSYDVDGNPVTYFWEVISTPPNSSAAFSDTAAVLTELTLDQNGYYAIGLTVTDDQAQSSERKLFEIDYQPGAQKMTAPIASVRFDQLRVAIGDTLVLDPFESTDSDGDQLKASTSLAVRPSVATASVDDQDGGLAGFTADTAGDYLVNVKVEDGRFFGYDHVLVRVGDTGNLRPVARIAPITPGTLGAPLQLDGAQSYDLDGDFITHSWSLLSRPAGSIATVQDAQSHAAGLTPDVAGLYVVQLAVSDQETASAPITQVIHVGTPQPRAIAGADQLADSAGQRALDGTLSSGTGTLEYAWSVLGLTSDTSDATLDVTNTALPTLQLGIGMDVFQDIVNDTPIYESKRPNPTCAFDTRAPADLTGADLVDITLTAHGNRYTPQGSRQLWEIENKEDLTRDVTLTRANGDTFVSISVPGKTSVFVGTIDVGTERIGAVVNGVEESFAQLLWPQGYWRVEQVCTGLQAAVSQLIVSDANGVSEADTVYVGEGNLRPVLTVGAPLQPAIGASVDLDATGFGFDGNGDPLNFSWALIKRPQSSLVELTTPIVAGPTLSFVPDQDGVYLVQLMADDGAMLAEPTVFVVDISNAPPVAAITGPTERFVGEIATLDGSTSSDPNNNALTYSWTLISQPAGSVATITDSSAVQASLLVDRRGEYVFQLVVSDFEFSSAPVLWTLTAPNREPIASFDGPAQINVDTQTVYSASGSNDPDNDVLSFAYSVVSAPVGANPQIVDLGNEEAGFAADVPGQYVLQVEVSDGLLTSTEQITVTVGSPNAPPVLGALNSLYTIELGLELALDLQGSDPDGDPISFFATPLPLAQGITLDAGSGEVRFRPETGQLGTYAFTVGVSDGVLTDEAVLNVEVVAASAGQTGVFGRVLDANDFAAGVETPLANIPVRLRDAALMTTSDASGNFSFGSLTAGGDQVIVEPSASGGPGGYLGTVRAITVTENQNRDLAPDFLLVPLDDGCVTVVAGQDTVLTGASSGVSVTIAADTIEDATGAAYTGDVCLGSLPQLFDHPGFDQDTQACRIYALDAPGAVFTQGITVTAPNLDNLPEQTSLDMWRLSQLSGLFRRNSTAGVDAGGATVSGIASNFGAATLFTFLPQAPRTMASADQPTGMQQLTPFNGDNAASYVLPGYTAFGEAQQTGLTYHSQAANPTIIVAGDVTIADDASLPVTLQTRLNIGGLSVDDTNQWTPRQGLNGATPALIGEAVTLRQSMPLDASGLQTGRYGYDFVARAQYDCSTVSASHDAELYVQNQTQSPYGTGWSITGLQTLVEAPDGKVSVHDDNTITTFDPKPTLTEFDGDPLVFPANGSQGIAAADFDNDGDLDIAFGETGDGAVSFITNYGDRDLRLESTLEFADPVNVPQTGTFPPNLENIAVGDLNNDDSVDVAYALQMENTYGFLENDGFGGFSEGFQDDVFAANNRLVLDVAVSDLDQDGYNDIIFGAFLRSFFFETDEIGVSYGSASGRILNRIAANSGGGAGTLQVLVQDVDGNGFEDVAFRTGEGVDFVFNNGSRNYTFNTLRAGNGGYDFTGRYAQLHDFNGDGFQDLIYSTATELQYLANTTGRAFSAPVNLQRPPSAASALPVNLGDANGDGLIDIIVASGGEVFVYISNGDGTFQPFETGFVNYPFFDSLIADVNGDGSLDLISSTRFNVRVHFSRPSASGEFVSGNGEFSTLSKLADGTWQRRYKDGTIVEFDASGQQTAMVDPQGNRKTYAYDTDNRLATITDQVGGITAFTYGAMGRLDTVTYPDGRVTTFTYDDAENLTQITEPTGSNVSFSYDQNGQLVSSTNQNGNTASYQYNAVGNLSGANLPDGSSISNQVAASLGLVDGLGGPAAQPQIYVEPEDRITTVTDRKGQTTEVIVNQFGSVVQVTDPLGRVTSIERDDRNLAVRVERPSNAIAGGVRVDLISYDSIANVESMTEAAGTPEERTTSYTYEPTYNKALTMTDPDGFVTTYEYDAFGEATRIIDPETGERLFTYTTEGKLATRTDKNGNLTSFAYNPDLNLDAITYADGSVTLMTYDTTGNTTVIAEAAGTAIERQVQRTYDALNRVLTVEVTAADGAQIDGITQYSYLPAGNLATVTDETGLVTTMGYDGLERLTSVDDPAEGLIQRVYNAAGEVTQHINGDGETHLYAYDNVSRLTQTTDPEGFVKAFAYDSRDNISTVTDGRGGLTSFGYDGLDRMTTRTNPINQTMTRAYDGRDNLLTLTREDGAVETATYDGLGRRTQVVTPDNTLSYAYDARGNLTEAADSDSRVTFTYDNRNRLATTTTDGTVGPQPQVTLTYTYDALDRRTSMSDSLGGTTTYAYDPEDRLTDLTAPWGTVYSFGYDGEGRRTALTSTSGRASSYGYTNGLLTALSHAQSGVALTNLAYEYGPDGQLTAIVDNLDPAQSKTISYDDLNRLIQVDEGVPASQGGVPVPVEDYAYDGEGNRTASHLSTLYSSNDHNQLLEDDSYTYAYDLKGNRVSRTAKTGGAVETYSYDSQNRLVGYVSGATTASYAYDALDRRVGKTIGADVQAFVYDPWSVYAATANDVALDFDNGALSKRWLHGPRVDEPLAYESYTGSTAAGSGSAVGLFANRLGSILTAVTLSTGAVAADYDYDSFGARTQIGTLEQRYGFTGREHDLETGLIYYRARHYDPAIGQFLQRDPIGFAAGDLNLYAYTWNDPHNWKDPSGLAATAEWTGTTGRTAGMAAGVVSSVSRGVMGLARAINLALKATNIAAMAGNDGDAGSDSGADSDSDAGEGGDEGDGGCEPNDPGCDPEENGSDDPDTRYDWTDHAEQEMMDENISPDDVYDAIENPINVRPGANNTTVFEGSHASAVVDNASLSTPRPRIVTVWE